MKKAYLIILFILTLNIVYAVDTTPPAFTSVPMNTSLPAIWPGSFIGQFEATDDIAIDDYFTNYTYENENYCTHFYDYMFCDDFESGTLGNWTVSGGNLSTTTDAINGDYSLQWNGVGTDNNGYSTAWGSNGAFNISFNCSFSIPTGNYARFGIGTYSGWPPDAFVFYFEASTTNCDGMNLCYYDGTYKSLKIPATDIEYIELYVYDNGGVANADLYINGNFNKTITGAGSATLAQINKFQFIHPSGSTVFQKIDNVLVYNSSLSKFLPQIFTINSSGALFNNTPIITPYDINVSVNDTSGNVASTIYKIIEDTTPPTAVFTYPTDANTTSMQEDTDFTLNWTFSDDNLIWSVNVSCSDGNTLLTTNISQASYTVNETWQSADPGNVSCSVRYCDAHTGDDIKDFSLKKTIENGTLEIESISIRSSIAPVDITTEKLKDRYTFCYDMDKPEKSLSFEIDPGCVQVTGSKYAGHFVCDDKYWLDFEPYENVKVQGHNVIVTPDKETQSFCFESVGELNCVDTSLQYIVTAAPAAPNATAANVTDITRFECDLSTTSKSIVYVGLLFFLLFIWMFSLMQRIPLLNIFVGLTIMFSGWYYAACIDMIMYVFIVMGISSWIKAIKDM